MERTGADAVPIVLLINFLALVMSFQSSGQLKQYGANIFLADLIGISMTRELAPCSLPLSSVVAQAQRLPPSSVPEGNEEIDALRTMGLDPMRYLVIPRVPLSWSSCPC